MTSVGPGYWTLTCRDSRAGAGVAPARAGTPRGRALAHPAAHNSGSAPLSQRTGAQASIDPFDASICPIDWAGRAFALCGALPLMTVCAYCGAPLVEGAPGRRSLPTAGGPPATAPPPIVLVLLDDSGAPVQRFERRTPDTTIGRQDGDIRFPEDVFLSPLHAKISWEHDALLVRDLGSRNGTWVFLEAPHRLADGDLLLIGSQVVRFRRLGYPGPRRRAADAARRMGSLIPSADIASLTQLRSDGSARDVIQLSPGRDVAIGREHGDWTFPYDPSMSARHAMIRSEDADFVVVDANSRNGVALAARGDIELRHDSRVLVGDKLLRVEIAT